VTDLTAGLQQNLKGRVCVIGIGNRLKGDDAAGPELIDRLTGRSCFHPASPVSPVVCHRVNWLSWLRRIPHRCSAARRRELHCLDVGVAPENYLEKIVSINPDTILLVDAMDFGGEAGTCRLFAADQITGGKLSSHALSLRMTCDYLQQRISARIFILGIQPAQLNMNRPLSAAVKAAVDKLAAELGISSASSPPPAPRTA